MKINFYPLYEEFIKSLKIYEASAPIPKKTKEELAQLAASIPKLEDMDEVVSPYPPHKTINMKKLKDEIEKAKYKIVTQSPLYRPYVHDMSPTIYTWLVPTMATDGVRLFVNPEFADSLSWLGKIFVLVHEIYHCLLQHLERGQGFDQELFNMAGDYEINAMIFDTNDDFDDFLKSGEFKGLYEKKYLNISAEEIYRDLEKNPPPKPPTPPEIEIDPTKMGGGGGPQPPMPPQPPQPPKKGKIKITPGTKVRIKSTGKVGQVTKVNADGTYEVDPINENLFIMNNLILESYKREEIIPILPKGSGGDGGGGGQSVNIEGEYEIEGGESEEEKKEGEKKEGQGQGQGQGEGEGKEGKSGNKAKELEGKAKQSTKGSAPMTPEEAAGEQRRISKKMATSDRGGTGIIIDPRLGEQIARASGYDDDEIEAGETGRQKWESNAKEMVEQLEKVKQAGSGRGDALINRLKKILKPATDWKTMLKIFVGHALSAEKYYRIGAKKHLHKSDEYLKRGQKIKRDALNKVIICVDFSGSMFGGQISAFDRCISEIQNIIYAKKIKEIVVIYFDDGVDPGSIQTVKRGEKVFRPKLGKGGGGTNFQKPLDWIKSKYNDHVNLCIMLTDGYADMPATPTYHKKFIWVVYDNEGFKVPFGRALITTSADLGA